MKLVLLTVGGKKESWLQELSATYEKKLKFFSSFEILRLKPVKLERASSDAKQHVEAELLLKAIQKNDFVIACDERGEALNSIKFSSKLAKVAAQGRPRIVVVVGGAFGLTDEIRRRADWIWSLSPLVMNHHVAQAVVLEQLYRAFAIQKNLPYHNE